MEVTKLKTLKVFLIIILKLSWKINLYLKVTVDCSYLTLTLLGYRLLGVKLDNGVE